MQGTLPERDLVQRTAQDHQDFLAADLDGVIGQPQPRRAAVEWPVQRVMAQAQQPKADGIVARHRKRNDPLPDQQRHGGGGTAQRTARFQHQLQRQRDDREGMVAAAWWRRLKG